MKYVVVEAVKLILMILCSFNIITRLPDVIGPTAELTE